MFLNCKTRPAPDAGCPAAHASASVSVSEFRSQVTLVDFSISRILVKLQHPLSIATTAYKSYKRLPKTLLTSRSCITAPRPPISGLQPTHTSRRLRTRGSIRDLLHTVLPWVLQNRARSFNLSIMPSHMPSSFASAAAGQSSNRDNRGPVRGESRGSGDWYV